MIILTGVRRILGRVRRLGKRMTSTAARLSLRERVRGLFSMGFVAPPFDGMQNHARMKFLYDSVRRFAPRSDAVALEIGCYKGCSTVFFAKACRRSGVPKVYAMDLFTGTPSWNQKLDSYDTAASRIAAYGLAGYVTLIRAHSLEHEWNADIVALHLDADHEYRAVTADVRRYAPFVVEGGIIVFDDYDTAHPGVVRAVHELLAGGDGFEIASVNYQRPEYGSLCIKRVGRKAGGRPARVSEPVTQSAETRGHLVDAR